MSAAQATDYAAPAILKFQISNFKLKSDNEELLV